MVLFEMIEVVKHLNINTISVCVLFIAIFCFFVYEIINRFCITKGKNGISKKQVLVIFIILSYVIIIVDEALLNRGIYNSNINLKLFSSHIQAWKSSNIRFWHYIILNVLMTIPLGLLLPLLHNKFHSVRWTMLAGVSFVFTIEILQFTTNSGVFDVDDIFNNCVGVLIGHGITMSILTMIDSKYHFTCKSFMYIIPLLIAIVIFTVVFLLYNIKEVSKSNSYGYENNKIDTMEAMLNSTIEGNYVFESLSYVSPLSSTLWNNELRKDIRYAIDKDNFSIEPGESSWINVSYMKEEIDSSFVKSHYGSETLTEQYTKIFFSQKSRCYRYIIMDDANKDIGYHIFQVGEDVYVCEVFEDYQRNGFLKIEKIKRVN